jgi:hypothetical protein
MSLELVFLSFIQDQPTTIVLWCLTPLSTLFQLYRGVSFIGGSNHQPAAGLWQTLSHTFVLLYRVHLAMSGIRIHNFSVDRH